MKTETTDYSPAVGSLIMSDSCVYPAVLVKDVAERFFESPQLDAIAVVEGREAIGLITRPKLLFSVFRRYGFELYGRKPIISLADTNPLSVTEHERLDVAIDMALSRDPQDIYDEIIIEDDQGKYRGILSVRQMFIQQSNLFANSIVQREMAHERAKELEKVNRVKSQFIANVTHELRSPVNAIIGLSELMKISCSRGCVDELTDRINLIQSSATHLRSIITNILDLSKIEAGKMEIIEEDFDLMRIITEVCETTRVLLGAKPIDVVVESAFPNLPMRSDPVKIKQILTNLMSNAAKFTEQGRIAIAVGVVGDKLTLTVTDTGPGIAKGDMDRLFAAFSQVGDVTTKRHEGTGLGLTITRSLLDLLGGCITSESKPGQGTAFRAILPAHILIGSKGGLQ